MCGRKAARERQAILQPLEARWAVCGAATAVSDNVRLGLQVGGRSVVGRKEAETETTANYGSWHRGVGEADARCNIAEIGRHSRRPRDSVHTGLDDRGGFGVEVGDVIVLLDKRGEDVVPNAEVQSQLLCDMPVILEEEARFPGLVGRRKERIVRDRGRNPP